MMKKETMMNKAQENNIISKHEILRKETSCNKHYLHFSQYGIQRWIIIFYVVDSLNKDKNLELNI